MLAFGNFPVVPGGGIGLPPPVDNFDSLFPPPPGGGKGDGGGGGGGGGLGAGFVGGVPGQPPLVANVVVPQAHVVGGPPPGFQPVMGQVMGGDAPPADFDALEARFKAITGGAAPGDAAAAPPAAVAPAPAPAGVTDDLEARLAALAGGPAAPAPEPEPAPAPVYVPPPAPAQAPAPPPPFKAPSPAPVAPPAVDDDLEARFVALAGLAPAPAPAPMAPRDAPAVGGAPPGYAGPPLGDDAMSAALLQRQPGESMDAYEARLGAMAATMPAPAPAPLPADIGPPPSLDGLDGLGGLDMLDLLPSVPGAPPAVGGGGGEDEDLEARFRRLQGGGD